ncbi:MAG: glycosyltransferase family 39 protein [Candidatus Pacebacteria bacterium]|nr:glycosyltransferase family 39 protein [Candidatus Paceibacterota bacterium]
MKTSKNTENQHRNEFIALLGLYFLGLGWLAVILTTLGFFYAWILAAYLVFGAAWLARHFSLHRKKIVFGRTFLIVLILSISTIILWSYYTTPTIFSGRDQGSFSQAAALLAQNHRLAFSFPAEKQFFQIYGPGKALNFPGFYYTPSGDLITQFPLGYISWLAIFFAFFGLTGFILANAVSFLIFLLSFYLLARKYSQRDFSLIAVFFVLTSFIFAWFFKFTLSENLALALVWFGLLELVTYLEKNSRLHLLATLASFGLLLFSRTEALAFLIMIAVLLFIVFRHPRKICVAVGKKLGLTLAGMTIIYFFSFKVNFYFYLTVVKGFIASFSSRPSFDPGGGNHFFVPFLYVLKLFSAYTLISFLILGTLGILYILRRKKYLWLVPAFVILPVFVYLVHPGISADHPWMLRRFLFAVVPGSIFYSAIFLEHFFPKKIYAYILAAFVLTTNLLVLAPYLAFSPDRNLLPQVKNIAANFNSSDLVLADPLATGDGWDMMTGPMRFLLGKQVVYFFNPNDLAKINTKLFNHVYLIIPDQNFPRYAQAGFLNKLITIKSYQIETSTLTTENSTQETTWNSTITLPGVQKNIIYGKIYLLKK